jgi:hypothetical protein
MNENIRSKIENFTALKEQASEKYYTWVRNIIAMAVGLLGILVSLKSSDPQTTIQHSLFSTSIGLIASGILSGSILLFAEIKLMREEIKIHAVWINKVLKNLPDKFDVKTIPNPWYFKLVKGLCYFSFSLSLISITLYTIYS